MNTYIFFDCKGFPAVIVNELTADAAFELARIAMQWPEIFYPAYLEIPPANIKTIMRAEIKHTLFT